MKTNVGQMDRIARAVIGVALIAGAVFGVIGVWGWVGVVPLATAMFSFCPVYAMFGMDSTHTSSGPKFGV